ncbi:MAG: 3-isopropylmalate dehydratase large subunit [Bacillota bacterium]
MSMTMVEKIIAAHANQENVKPGDVVSVDLDLVLGNDVTTPVALTEFEKIGVKDVYNKEKIAIVPDHFTPNKDINSAEQSKLIREFATKKEIENYFEIGEMGIEHCLLPEKGLTLPGQIIIGADSHTCTYGAFGTLATGVGSTDMAVGMATGKAWLRVPETIKFIYKGKLNKWVSGKDLILYTIGDIGVDGALYKAMEFDGNAVKELSMAGRMTMSNMAIEAGGKCGLIEPDQKTFDYLKNKTDKNFETFKSDKEANFSKVVEYDVSNIEPQVAFPHLPENTKPISEVKDVKIDQVVIGSCTNGRLEDLRMAANILKGNKKADHIRLIVFPGTQKIYLDAMKEGIIETLINAGAAVSTPTCGPCLGGHMGILAKGERALATTNRNFVGRMGHPESEVYLSNPSVAAASAIAGKIVSPEEVM